jgi:hypothetical protein
MLEHLEEDSAADSPLARRLEAVARFARVGGTCVVADERGLCVELRVKVSAGEAIVASGPADRLRAGSRVSGRVFVGRAIWNAIFEVEEVEETGIGRADGLFRIVELQDRGDDRGEPRYTFDAAAVCVPADTYTPASELRSTQLRICDVSRAGVAFLADRRFDPGEAIDLAFTDEAGATIHARVQVSRAERAVYGRTRYASRILAIGEIDELRLERLCNRCRLRDDAAGVDTTAELSLRELLVSGDDGNRGGIRRLFGRA